ncbi:hypothetical protein, unlikely [Trypanosoma brucei gambiense DAL972]|uniref:Uncharacterized protein n=1 Tax=Trypanosoma brucei gambiense (strain MHOM/CI/86/DAL972) TaxID=679716 RepID=C9ZRM4_TRYB9|nr:hypothetical protein, unlikely [Trypanosoma brucei gambiense DAL972]CBH12326.1 hypothetical protein, unlikely [Trypanosoma brucei gambiense DAL972]|eukprot:XP_011774607.1 hypothetical protein, unlikely [Trypanosoma brucei gambiense DAL972]
MRMPSPESQKKKIRKCAFFFEPPYAVTTKKSRQYCHTVKIKWSRHLTEKEKRSRDCFSSTSWRSVRGNYLTRNHSTPHKTHQSFFNVHNNPKMGQRGTHHRQI